MKKIILLSTLFLFAGTVFAEHEFALSLSPAFEIPSGKEPFGPGAGAAAAFDWAFLPFMGVSGDGAVSALSVADGSAFTLYRAGIGPFFRWRPFDRWTFRAGIRAGLYQYRWEDYRNTRPFAGFGLRAEFHLLPSLSLYAGGDWTLHAFSDNPLNTFNLGAGIRLNLSEIMRGEARVRGEKTEQRRIFPVSWAWYKDNPAAVMRITNDEPNTITDVNLSLFMDRYMGQPEPFAVIPRLGPGETREVPVTALFNEVMLSLTGNISANGQVLMRYRSLGAWKETAFAVQMPVYHRNALSWDDDRRAAAFVSARDPAARLFARYTASITDSLPARELPRNVRHAAALFEALAAYGIHYVIDPASSFVEFSGNASAVDSLNYPYQTLYYRGGDCDDLSILYCAMLEVLGVDTAFITIPGHIYCAFDIGIPVQGEGNQGEGWWRVVEGLIEYGGKLWMPVEITALDEGFYGAWRIGAREWRAAANGSLAANNSPAGETRQIYPMRESWAVYPPVTVPEAGDTLPELPAAAEIARRFGEAVERFNAF